MSLSRYGFTDKPCCSSQIAASTKDNNSIIHIPVDPARRECVASS